MFIALVQAVKTALHDVLFYQNHPKSNLNSLSDVMFRVSQIIGRKAIFLLRMKDCVGHSLALWHLSDMSRQNKVMKMECHRVNFIVDLPVKGSLFLKADMGLFMT